MPVGYHRDVSAALLMGRSAEGRQSPINCLFDDLAGVLLRWSRKIWMSGSGQISSPTGSKPFRTATSAITGAHRDNTQSAFPPVCSAPYVPPRVSTCDRRQCGAVPKVLLASGRRRAERRLGPFSAKSQPNQGGWIMQLRS